MTSVLLSAMITKLPSVLAIISKSALEHPSSSTLYVQHGEFRPLGMEHIRQTPAKGTLPWARSTYDRAEGEGGSSVCPH